MVSSLSASSTVQQVQQVQRVQQGFSVAAVAADATVSLCNRDSCTVAPQPRNARRKSKPPKTPGDWRPAWAMLPALATLERLSQPGGVPVQQRLFDDALPDDTRQGRLVRLLAGVPGVVTADRLPPTHRGHTSPGGYGQDRCAVGRGCGSPQRKTNSMRKT